MPDKRPRRMWILSAKDRLLLQSIGTAVVLVFLVKDLLAWSPVKIALDLAILVWSGFEIRRLLAAIKARRS